MTGWHLDDAMLRRYVERTDSLAEGASAEQHLLACGPCRARVGAAASVTELSVIDFAAVWDRTRDAVEVPRPSVFERLLRGAGLSAQEARLVAVASAFRGDGDIAAWLWGIAIRRLVSRLRTRGGAAAVSGPAGVAPAAEDQVLLSVEYGDIGQALARLSPEMRAVIQAVVLDGLSAKEAAQLLHVPVSSVKTRLYRAKAHLRAALAEGPS